MPTVCVKLAGCGRQIQLNIDSEATAQELRKHITSATGNELDDGTLVVHRGRIIRLSPSQQEFSDAASEDIAPLVTRKKHANCCFLEGDVLVVLEPWQALPASALAVRQAQISAMIADDDEDEDEPLFEIPASASQLQRQLGLYLRDRWRLPDLVLAPFFWLSLQSWGLVLAWFIAAPVLHALFELGPIYILLTFFLLIFFNLGQRRQGEASAYSIFNEGFRELPGTLNAARLDDDIRGGRF